jgi:prepilin-type processing-associated H-X9-DG protein
MGRLPAGNTTLDSGTRDVMHTWASFILPYMEESAQYDNIDFSVPSWQPYVASPRGRKEYAAWTYTPLDIHLCPSDLGRGEWWSGDAYGFTHGNYLANIGTRDWYQKGTEAEDKVAIPPEARGPFERAFSQKNKGVELREITDGLSKTSMLGETRLTPGLDSRGILYLGTCYYHSKNTPNSNAEDSSEWCSQDQQFPELPCTDKFEASRGPYRNIARSRHPGGVQIAFCDGHVDFESDDVNLCVWYASASRAGSDELATTLVQNSRDGTISCQ